MLESFTLPTENISNSPQRARFPRPSGKYVHVRVKVAFTEVSFEHAWIEVSVSICFQGQSLSRFGAVAKQWKLRTSNHGLGNEKSQNVRIFKTSRMLCELLYVLSVWSSHAFNCLPAISAGTTGKTLTCTVSMRTCTFWNFGLSLVHFHKQVTQKRGALHSTMGPQPMAGYFSIVEC
jgi:hypothetical protein